MIAVRPGVDDTDRAAILALYAGVGWTAYTADPDATWRAIQASPWAATAWDGDRLIGFARVLSDDVAIAWLQDVLVAPTDQRRGVGRALVEAALTRFAHVRTFALMTDDEPRQHAFYASLGLADLRHAHGGRLHTFARWVTPARPSTATIRRSPTPS